MKSFVTPQGTHALRGFFANLPKDKRYRVTIEEYKSKRSLEQNSRYWLILSFIAEQVKPEGREYSPEVWHEWAKAKFLGKDTIVIDGEPVLVQKTTTKLKVLEFGDYMTQVEVWAVDHNVHFYESLNHSEAAA